MIVPGRSGQAELGRIVVEAVPAGRPERAGRLCSYGQALLTRATLLGETAAATQLRHRYPGHPQMWAPFIHIGP